MRLHREIERFTFACTGSTVPAPRASRISGRFHNPVRQDGVEKAFILLEARGDGTLDFVTHDHANVKRSSGLSTLSLLVENSGWERRFLVFIGRKEDWI